MDAPDVIVLKTWFRELQGAQMQLWLASASHSSRLFKLSLPDGRFAELYLSYTCAMELINPCTNVRFRLGTPEEEALLIQRAPRRGQRWWRLIQEQGVLEGPHHLIVDSDEGQSQFWVLAILFEWRQIEEFTYVDHPIRNFSDHPWNDSPPLSDL